MFHTEFYPTPAPIAIAMAEAMRRDRTPEQIYPILDPSAGKGDLLKPFKQSNYSKFYRSLFAIEINPDLVNCLKGAEINVIGSDFLQFNEIESWNSIIMNPPFSKGIEHLFHAWKCLKPGGRIVCLLPDTTRTNNSQKLQEIIRLYGYSTAIGACFEDAERKTSVPILAIVLDKPEINFNFNFEFSSDNFAEEMFESAIAAGSTATLGKVDIIETLVHQYELAQEAIREQAIANQKLKFALNGVKSLSSRGGHDHNEIAEFDYEKAIAEVKEYFWDLVFKKTELEKRCTSNFKKKFWEFQKEQAKMAFNKENITNLLMMFWENKAQIDVDSVCYVFDKITSHHKKNVAWSKGWKTNKAKRLNNKIILPAWDAYGLTNYDTESTLEDLDKICCIISGNYSIESLKEETIKQKVYRSKTYGEGESFFFYIKTFKCGSVHLKFKDEKICEEINKIVAKERKWIGSDY